MRALEIFERAINKDPALNKVKDEIISGVKRTTDSDLLEKIRTALYSTNIKTKIENSIAVDGDVAGHIKEITNIILNTEGSVEEKLQFAEGLKYGYVDVAEMLSGERVHFEDLIKAPKGMKHAPLSFALKIFDALRQYTPSSKGPGEFALAVLSPSIKINGEGDLKIGKHKIEVKASTTSGGGSMLETGQLSHENIPGILMKHGVVPQGYTGNFGISGFGKAIQKMPEIKREKMGRELWSSIFSQFEGLVDLSPLIAATTKGDRTSIDREFIKAAYKAYQGGEKNRKFDGVMLINFDLQELQYFDDPNELSKNVLALDSQLISDKAARTLNPRTTLARRDAPKPKNIPSAGKAEWTSEVDAQLTQLASWLVTKQFAPGSLITPVADYMTDLWMDGTPVAKIADLTVKHFPRLQQAPTRLRPAKPQAAPAPAAPNNRAGTPQAVSKVIGSPPNPKSLPPLSRTKR